MTYGQTLSASTLSGGSAAVAGSFAFASPSTIPTAAGTYSASVIFTPTDAANYDSATNNVDVTVNQATPVITWSNPADITYGTALSATQLNATSGGVAGNFVYTPASGTVPNAGSGQTLSVLFTPSDSANYSTPSAKTVTINVNKADQTVSFTSGASVTKTYGDAAFVDTATATSGGTVTYSSDNTSVATVNSSGTVTVVGAGSAHILANSSATANYNAAPQASQTLTVNQANQTVSFTSGASVTKTYGDAAFADTATATSAAR